jgi:ribonuclease P protein component
MNDRRRDWRLAVVVSRKVSKSAVIRNRIRRRIYEVIRLHQDQIVGSYDFIFIVFSPQLTELEPKKLTASVMELMEKAGVLNAKSQGPQSAQHDIVKTKED